MIIEIFYAKRWEEKVKAFVELLPTTYSYGVFSSHDLLINQPGHLRVVVRDKDLILLFISYLRRSLEKEEINLEKILKSYDPPFEVFEWLELHNQV